MAGSSSFELLTLRQEISTQLDNLFATTDNDSFRRQIILCIEPLLREAHAKRLVFNYKIVCDETNNSVGSAPIVEIYIQPSYSIKHIVWNFSSKVEPIIVPVVRSEDYFEYEEKRSKMIELCMVEF